MQDKELNERLKKMWKLNEKAKLGKQLTFNEKVFWNEHLTEITDYYARNANLWSNKIKFSEP